MGLWHDIHAADMLLRAGTHEGAAAESKPVAHGIVSDHVHDQHVTAYPDRDGVWYEYRTDAAIAQDLVGGGADEAAYAMADSFGYAEATVREINPFLVDGDEPFAPCPVCHRAGHPNGMSPLPFRTSGWSDAGACTTCYALGKYGIEHRGCGGLFTIIYE